MMTNFLKGFTAMFPITVTVKKKSHSKYNKKKK